MAAQRDTAKLEYAVEGVNKSVDLGGGRVSLSSSTALPSTNEEPDTIQEYNPEPTPLLRHLITSTFTNPVSANPDRDRARASAEAAEAAEEARAAVEVTSAVVRRVVKGRGGGGPSSRRDCVRRGQARGGGRWGREAGGRAQGGSAARVCMPVGQSGLARQSPQKRSPQ